MDRPYTPVAIIPRDGDFREIEVFDYGDHVEIFDCVEDVHVSKKQLDRLIDALVKIRDSKRRIPDQVSPLPVIS
jgi:hypothetical protein